MSKPIAPIPREYAARRPSDLEPFYSRHVDAMTREGLHAKAAIAAELAWRDAEIARLRDLINTPHVDNFLEAVRIEAAHQCERWGTVNDAGKAPSDWFWLLGFLAGKAVHAAVAGNTEKARHHTISSAAALLNWHAHLSGERTRMRPGIAEPVGGTP